MASVQAEVRELLDYIRSLGFQCALEKDGHWHVYRQGKAMRLQNNAPVTLPATPSDWRWRESSIATLKEGRVIEEDPKKLQQISLAKRDPELKRLRTKIKEQLAAQPKVEKVRKPPAPDPRLEPLRQAVGGMLGRLDVSQAEFVRLAMKTAESKGMRTFGSHASGEVFMGRFLSGMQGGRTWMLDMLEAVLKDLDVLELRDGGEGQKAIVKKPDLRRAGPVIVKHQEPRPKPAEPEPGLTAERLGAALESVLSKAVPCKVEGCDEKSYVATGRYALLCGKHRLAKERALEADGLPTKEALAELGLLWKVHGMLLAQEFYTYEDAAHELGKLIEKKQEAVAA